MNQDDDHPPTKVGDIIIFTGVSPEPGYNPSLYMYTCMDSQREFKVVKVLAGGFQVMEVEEIFPGVSPMFIPKDGGPAGLSWKIVNKPIESAADMEAMYG